MALRLPCPCEQRYADHSAAVFQLIEQLRFQSNPLVPFETSVYYDGKGYGHQVVFYVKEGQLATELQVNPEWSPKCKDAVLLYKHAQDITPSGSRLLGHGNNKRLPMTQRTARKLITDEQHQQLVDDGADERRFCHSSGRCYDVLEGTKWLYPLVTYMSNCAACVRHWRGQREGSSDEESP